jgi:fumarate hydratase class II
MLVTALAPHIGYERAAAIARHAHEHGTSLRDAAKTMGVSDDDFTAWVVPERMARPHE